MFTVLEPLHSRLKVLVTRPEQQAKSLCNMLDLAGGEAVAFPVIDIVPIDMESGPSIDLLDYALIIFVSRNAVKYFMYALKGDMPDNLKVGAMGSGTAACLHDYDVQVDIQAPAPAGSESLLTVPALNNVKNTRILIVRGEGGRELLADTLIERGAKVNYLNVYKRNLPIVETKKIAQAKSVDCVVITSVKGLDNLCELIADDSLKNKWLIVVSERIKQHAIQKGFLQVRVADDASDIAVMQQVNKVEKMHGKK